MQAETLTLLPLSLGILAGLLALATGLYLARRVLGRARGTARLLLADARAEAENRKKEILVAAQERILVQEEEAERRERELEDRDAGIERRLRKVESQAADLDRQRARAKRALDDAERKLSEASAAESRTGEALAQATTDLERIAGLTHDEARSELVRKIEDAARADADRLARKIEDDAKESAERRAVDLMIRASQRVKITDVVESTVSFLELPSDEMKGRIIGREGRNIRALEMATGIDLIVDDTPRSILISSFDPIRREVACVAIQRLVEDGRIHPARIEEVVQKVEEEIEQRVDEKGTEAAFGLGISDLHPKLVRLVGLMRYHTTHGQNLLQHSVETALIAGYMAQELGARPEVARRAGLLHEIGQVDTSLDAHPIQASAELCNRYRESEAVVHAVRSVHPDVEARSTEALLVATAGRMSDNRPGARKENLAVFIERLRRLEKIATDFDGVNKAYAVKAGKEIRVLVDAGETTDQSAQKLCKEIARAVERDLSYPGQIKVGVVRETRAVRYAL